MIEEKKGIVGKGGHFEEYCRCINKFFWCRVTMGIVGLDK